ncbi:HNH endonuclease signature motif containing protein [Hymenobacter sp. BT491]|uniref:HNH endonuclease signature motif containing protein n=1 Tax=Hymenobacter sp. BT491 TaxID=2766779 RepID=UPI001653703E|nr:HNH endonuclease signature motif containing protein [Hymenobacter sp. BT491]MBC6988973.1 HNH endonuclease [Hymenobacter sp. BT491]
MTRRMFTEAERAYIATHYETQNSAEIALALGRTQQSIKLYVQRNGLKKGGVSHTRFRKGIVPWNKGLKGWAAPGSEKGHFPKGNTPHNAVGYYDGIVTVRQKNDGDPPYKYRRMGKARWVLSHRYNFEQANGPIPKGHVLRCRDGNTLNDQPENWELVTRQENAARNAIHGEHRASLLLSDAYVVGTLTKGKPELRPHVAALPHLIETQRLRITLNRTIRHELEK